jgi:hypothetical protein
MAVTRSLVIQTFQSRWQVGAAKPGHGIIGNFLDFKHEVTLEAIPFPPGKFPRLCVTWLS